MMKLIVISKVKEPVELVINNFGEDLFLALSPRLIPFKLIGYDGDRVGGLVRIQIGFSVLQSNWVSKIISRDLHDDRLEFVDVGMELPFPLQEWKHKHIVKRNADGATAIIDDIEFTTGTKVGDYLIYPFLYSMFALRIPAYKKYFRDIALKSS